MNFYFYLLLKLTWSRNFDIPAPALAKSSGSGQKIRLRLHNTLLICLLCICIFTIYSMYMHIYVKRLECRTVWHPVSLVPDEKKLTKLKQVRYRTKPTHFFVQHRTKILDAGMPMPALVSSMLIVQLC